MKSRLSCSVSESPLLFLDANILASPVTRTLVIAGARADGLRRTWSAHVEKEADGHARGTATRTSTVRKEILKTELSPTAASTLGLKTQTVTDQQVIADAIRASARFLITTNVDDFAFDDLAAHEISAVNPDTSWPSDLRRSLTAKVSACSPRCSATRHVQRRTFTKSSAGGTHTSRHGSPTPMGRLR